MRTASEIVESVTREVLDTAGETTDSIDRRATEFTHVALAAPAGTIQRDVAAVVATKLFRLSTSLSMQRFRL